MLLVWFGFGFLARYSLVSDTSEYDATKRGKQYKIGYHH